MIAGYRDGQLIVLFTVEGACNRTVFETWLSDGVTRGLKGLFGRSAKVCIEWGSGFRALKLLRSVKPGMLLMWDRSLHSYAMVKAILGKGCDYLGRIPANVKFLVEEPLAGGSYLSWIYPPAKLRKRGDQPIQVRVIEYTIEHPDKPGEQLTYRLITSLLNIEQFSATLLAAEYHQRWEAENTIDEIKTHLLGRKTPIRSGNPPEVVQEVYGWLLGHWAVWLLMLQAATSAGVPLLRLSFTGTLRVIRRAFPSFNALTLKNCPFFQLVDCRDSG